ncbi:MAG: hypothetical protein AB8G99_23000, partial [Planctomycetaceae bacterium]
EWDVFVRVAGNVVKTMGADVELLQDGTPIAEQTIVINGDESQRLSFRVTADAQCSLQVKLMPDSFDSLESDNVAWLDLPEGRGLRVDADTGLASWRHALSGVENLELYPLSDDASEPPQYDAIVSDSVEGLEMDGLVKVMIGVIPPDLRELIEPSEGQTEIVDWNRTEPLLQHVQLSDITIVDPPARKEGVVDNQIEELGYEILVWGDGGPLLLKQRDGVKLSLYFLFHTDSSTLPYRLAFPITVANSMNMALQATSLSEVRGQRTGVLDPIRLVAEREYDIGGPDGSSRTIETNEQGVLSGVPAPVVGEYALRESGAVTRKVGAGLLDQRETSLNAVEEIQFREIAVGVAETTVKNDRPLWKLLAVVAFVILLIEWWFFQRRPDGT